MKSSGYVSGALRIWVLDMRRENDMSAGSGESRVQIPPRVIPAYLSLVEAHTMEVAGSNPAGACSVAQSGRAPFAPGKIRVAFGGIADPGHQFTVITT